MGRLCFIAIFAEVAQRACGMGSTSGHLNSPLEAFDSCNNSQLGAQCYKMWAKDPRTEA